MTALRKIGSLPGRWLGEFFTILIGVLAALAVDDWRETLQEREQERHYLEGIRADLSQDIVDFMEVLEDGARRAHAIEIILEAVEDEYRPVRNTKPYLLADDRDMNLAEAARSVLSYSRLEYVEVTYQEMVNSNGLRLIEDEALRRLIAEYYALARDRSDLNPLLLEMVRPANENLLQRGVSPVDAFKLDDPIAPYRDSAELRARLRRIHSFTVAIDPWVAEMIEVADRLDAAIETSLH